MSIHVACALHQFLVLLLVTLATLRNLGITDIVKILILLLLLSSLTGRRVQCLPAVRVLRCNACGFSELPADSLAAMTQLRELHMSGNPFGSTTMQVSSHVYGYAL